MPTSLESFLSLLCAVGVASSVSDSLLSELLERNAGQESGVSCVCVLIGSLHFVRHVVTCLNCLREIVVNRVVRFVLAC